MKVPRPGVSLSQRWTPGSNRQRTEGLTRALAAPIGSVTARVPSAFLRKRVPLAWLQLAVLFAVLGTLPVVRDVDPDFWWHLRTGELIFDSGIPRHDVFSWTAAGRPWVAHEWLSEAIIYAVESAFGYIGNIVLFDAAAIGALVLMYALARHAGAGTRLLVLLMLMSVLMFVSAIAVRPQLFSWLFFAIFVFVLERDYQGQRAPSWLLPALMAVWVNLHLGFVYGLVLVGLWIASLMSARTRDVSVDLRRPLLIGGACLLATLLNPHGPDILVYPYRYIEDRHSVTLISEWQRPSPLNPRLFPFFAGVALIAWSLLSKHRPGLFLCLVSVLVIALALQAVRNLPYAGLLLLPGAGPTIARKWRAASNASDSCTSMSVSKATVTVGALVCAVVVLAMQLGDSFSLSHPDARTYPTAGARYLRANLGERRLYNDYTWGGYLIYTLYPDVPLFIDGRSDFYRSRIVEDYAAIGRLQPGWEDLMRQYGIDAVLLRKGSSLARGLREDSRWKEVFTGPVETVLVRVPDASGHR
jgi:hypothetical protein